MPTIKINEKRTVNIPEGLLCKSWKNNLDYTPCQFVCYDSLPISLQCAEEHHIEKDIYVCTLLQTILITKIDVGVLKCKRCQCLIEIE